MITCDRMTNEGPIGPGDRRGSHKLNRAVCRSRVGPWLESDFPRPFTLRRNSAPGVSDGIRETRLAIVVWNPPTDVQTLDRIRRFCTYEAQPAGCRLPAGEVLGGGFEPLVGDEGSDDETLTRRQDHLGPLGLREADLPGVAVASYSETSAADRFTLMSSALCSKTAGSAA
jgi:hypothetical protein